GPEGVLRLVPIQHRVGMIAVRDDNLKQGWLARNMVRLPHIGKAGVGNSKLSGASSKKTDVQAVLFPWHAVKVVTNSEVQREIWANLPIVFEERTPFILVIVLDPRDWLESLFR